MSGALTRKQREALQLIRRLGFTYVGDPNFYVPLTSEGTQSDAWTCWLNWRTAEALERRGFGRCQGSMEEAEFVLFGRGGNTG